jgi:uncharacterized protein (DUF433 family)
MPERITFDSTILGRRACIRGLRLPVSLILGQLAHGATHVELLTEYPDLEPEDLSEAMEYTARLATEDLQR